MDSSTRQRLDEAAFFLARLKEAVGDGRPPLKREVQYYLNAFVSAARTVTWVMRHEYGRKDGWEEWFKSVQLSEDEQRLLTRFNDFRVQGQKKAPLEPRSAPMIAPELVPIGGGWVVPGPVNIRPDPAGTEPFLVEGGKVLWFVELDGLLIVSSCTDYLGLLVRQVDACEVRFKSGRGEETVAEGAA